MMRSLFVVMVVTGCGFNVEAGLAPGDGSTGDAPDDGPHDAPLDTPPSSSCLAKWMAGTVQLSQPTQLLQLGSPTDDDRDPFISTDELTLYFSSDRTGSAGNSDIYAGKRLSRTGSFGTPTKVADLSSGNYDTRVSLSGDELTAVRSADVAGDPDLALATRTNTSGVFGSFSPALFDSINDTGPQLDPELSYDGMRLYFSEGSPQKIVMISRAASNAPFGNPIVIDVGGGSNADPALSDDERILIFASSRSGAGDIYYATRASASGPFGAPTLVPTINDSNDADGDPTLSSDGCTLYFASNRGTGGDWDLYASTVVLP